MSQDLETVRAVLGRHRDAIMARRGVTGVGIGAGAEPGTLAIVVYLDKAVGTANHTLPSSLEGVPVRYVVTGAIRSQ